MKWLAALLACVLLPMAQPAHSEGLVRRGDGSPTVVFEAGLGDTAATWNPVLAKVGALASTFTYTRAGYGGRPAPAEAPTAQAVAHSLHDQLVQSGASAPYVLVGHSLGGAYVLAFAKLYPSETRAVVLVDGTPPWQTQMLRQDMPGLFKTLRVATSLMGPGAAAEFAASQDDGDGFDRLGPFPPVRLIYLLAGRHSPMEGGAFRRRVDGLREKVLALSPCAQARPVPGAGHYIHKDQPAAVVEAIGDVLADGGCLAP